MPSFVCDHCQETLKKAKLDQHAQRCRQACFSCIDCYKTFKGVEYRAHFSCITEVQKYHVKQQPAVTAPVNSVVPAAAKPVTPAASPVKEDSKPSTISSDSKLTSAIKKILKSETTPSNFKVIKKQLKKSLGKSSKKLLQEGLQFTLNKDTNELIIKLQ